MDNKDQEAPTDWGDWESEKSFKDMSQISTRLPGDQGLKNKGEEVSLFPQGFLISITECASCDNFLNSFMDGTHLRHS